MKALRYAALLLFIALGAAADEGTRFRAELVGAQEVPAIFTAGSAIYEMRVLENDTGIEFTLTYENLTAPPVVAHVHFGQRGVSGGVSFFFCGGAESLRAQPPLPARSRVPLSRRTSSDRPLKELQLAISPPFFR